MEPLASSELIDASRELWSISLGIATPFAVKAAVKIGLFDILGKVSSGSGATLEEILSELQHLNPQDSPQPDRLFRLVRFLVAKKVLLFNSVESRYSLTPVSKLLTRHENNQLYAAPILHWTTSELMTLSWLHVDEVVKNPGPANGFVKAHGMEPKEYISKHPEIVQPIEEFRVSGGMLVIQGVLQNYHGFKSIKKLVDVGGGSGCFAAEVVKHYPHIDAVNLDLAEAFANTIEFPGVKNIVGNALESIPSGDGMLVKNVVHMFDDAEALKLLTNCYRALERNGRVVICDMVMDEKDELHLECDMLFLAGVQRYERTKDEWNSLLASAGFENIGFFDVSPPFSIIEALKLL